MAKMVALLLAGKLSARNLKAHVGLDFLRFFFLQGGAFLTRKILTTLGPKFHPPKIPRLFWSNLLKKATARTWGKISSCKNLDATANAKDHMEIIHSPSEIAQKASCVTIGNFDGLHLGHQSLIRRVKEISAKEHYQSIVITFWPHPRQVVTPDKPHFAITTRERRLELLAAYNLDTILELPFTKELANHTPEEFVLEYLKPLETKYLITGYDFSLGRGRSAHTKELVTLGQKWGFVVEQMPPLMHDGTIVSSTHLRSLISQGALDQAEQLLGRPYQLLGIVRPGAARGRTLGFPTANILPPNTLLPATGVYAAYATIGQTTSRALVNIGHNPTFGDNPLSIESYLLDLSGDFYDCRLTLSFVARLRPEQKFNSPEDLVNQIKLDLANANKIFAEKKN